MTFVRECFACGKPTEVEIEKLARLRPAMEYPYAPRPYLTKDDPDGRFHEADMRRYNEEVAKLKKEYEEEMLEVRKDNDPYCGCLDKDTTLEEIRKQIYRGRKK